MLHNLSRDYIDVPPDISERITRTAKQIELELIPWDKITLTTIARYLVKNVIPASGLVVVYGPPKCGKTFWIFDLVMHIALGWEYRSHRTHQGSVVYCLFEGQAGFTARAEAFRQNRLAEQAEEVPFHLMNTRIALVADHQKLVAAVKHHSRQAPAVVVLDTLNRSFTGSESSDADMTAYVSAADAIRDAFDCAVIIVHHCGLEAGRPRGHTALLGAADTQIGVKQDGARNVITTVEYQKDGPADTQIISRLKVVDVGIDDDGEPITSCIVEPSETSPEPTRSKVSLTPGARIALDALKKAIAEQGKVPPASNHIPSSVKTVTVDVWRRYAYQMGISTSDQDRAKQLAFKRGTERLLAAHIAAQWGEQCWLTA